MKAIIGSVFLSAVYCNASFATAASNPLYTFDDPTITNGDEFGYSVALDDNHVLIGARRDRTFGTNVGQAHLFEATTGSLLQTFDNPTVSSQGLFGHSVALDAHYALIGAPNDHSGDGTGQAYLFDATTGSLLRNFADPTITQFDQFGWSVALDGNYVLIGDRGDDTKGNHVGQAHLFDANTGSLLHTFDDPTPIGTDNFGWSVAVDDNYVLIGAPSDSTFGMHVGQAHLFDAASGSLLMTFNDPTVTAGDAFGYSVAVDDNYVLIGAREDDTNGLDVGQVHLFDAVTGSLVHTFDDPTVSGSDFFGYSLALDGNHVLIGENTDGTNGGGLGQAHLFNAATGALTRTFDAPIPTLDSGFGTRVALDTNYILIGALADDTNGRNVGQAHLYNVPESSTATLFVAGVLIALLYRLRIAESRLAGS